ncbi:MAG: mannitol-1-phosphate 5-dehydrogenase [Chthonomonadales bacterium]
MKPTAVQFGAGAIGRGFIAQLFHESGYRVVFVDVVPQLLQAINERGRYTIHIVGEGSEDVLIDDICAVDGRDQAAVAEALAGCAVASTAVGAGALEHIAGNLAAGLQRRREQGGGPLNVLVCENLHDAAGLLRNLVAEHLPASARHEILAQVGFVQAVVSRMVPVQQPGPGEDPLAIRVEAYKRLPVDGRAVVGTLAPIAGVEPVANFEGYVEQKLYTHNCGHAALGYLGYQYNLVYGYEALEHPSVRPVLDEALRETSAALVRKHGFTEDEQRAHVEDLLRRFGNRALGDTCLRLARDPMRKLAPDDRLVGALRLCEDQGIEPAALPLIIAAALRFDYREDPSAEELQRRINERGVEAVLKELCGISVEEEAGRKILEAYRRRIWELSS